MEFRTIRQTSHIEGVNRNPGAGEHDKLMAWDNNSQKVKYVLVNGLNANSKTADGYVAKGDDSSAANYIWKLDASKNPSWRLEEYLASISKVGNSAVFTMNSGSTKTLALGSLAWQDSVTGAVTSVFGRSGDVLASSGDYTAAKVTNAFDKLNDTLDDVSEGDTVKYFTSSYKSQVDANTLARHVHSNILVLDAISDAGDGVIPTSAQISEWDTYSTGDAQNVMDTVDALIQDNAGISWVYDDGLNTLTPTIDLGDFTLDDLPEGAVNKYPKQYVYTITLPSASTVAGRISAAIEGSDYPTGWVLTADDIDIHITHSMDRRIASVNVFSNSLGVERLLLGNAAYSGLFMPYTITYDEVVIEALATIETDITIQLIFA